jgi:hypothetical protein
MGEILNLPSYYGVSTSCATRLMLAKLILLYSFWSEPWESILLIMTGFIRRVPWLGGFDLPINRIFTPVLSLEMITNSLVLTGILVESGICLVPWLGLNMLVIGVTSFMLLDSALHTGGGNLSLNSSTSFLQTELSSMSYGNQMLLWLCLLYILCQQYSSVLEIYFFLYKRSMLFFPRLLEDTPSLEEIQVDKKAVESCYQPVVASTNNNNNFKTTVLASAKNINYVNAVDEDDAEKDENTDTIETSSLLSYSTTNQSSGLPCPSPTDTIPPVPNTPPPTSTPLQPQMIFQSSFQPSKPSLPGAYLEMEIKSTKMRSRTQSRASRTSKDYMVLEKQDGKNRASLSEQELPANRKSWESFKFSLEKENFE